MNKRLFAILLAFTLVIQQTPFFADDILNEEILPEKSLVVQEYLVKYNADRVLEKSPVRMTTEANREGKSIEAKEDVEILFKERLPEVSRVEIKDELSEDSLGCKTQLLSIESEDTEAVLAQLREMDGVEYAEPNYKIDKLYDPSFNNQWGLNPSSTYDINIADAWGITYGNSDIVVAVIDTGIDINHPDLEANIYTSADTINGVDSDGNGYKDDLHGWDFTTYIDNVNNGDNSVYDDPEIDEHGTHVAGIIAASQNDIGVQGVAPNVKILPLKVLGEDGGTVFHAIKAIEYANSKGVKIANCSWGFGYYSQFLYDAMNQSDMLFVCASGNDGIDFAQSKTYPAAYELDNMVSVAAMTSSGSIASFSNYGQGVDVAAPGENIYSTLPGNKYGNLDGTSMAAPFVAGVAALIKSISPESLASDMKDRILQMTIPNSTLIGKVGTGGYLNASGSVMTAIEPANMPSPRYGAGYVTVGGAFYAVGGYDGNSYLNTIVKFDPATNIWQNVRTLPQANAEMAVAAYGDNIYIFGGTNTNALRAVRIFNTKKKILTTGASMPANVYASAVATIGNKAYIFGGLTDNGYSNKVYAYDFTNDSWETKTDLPFSFAYGQAAVSNDVIYILGGANSNGCLNGIYEYDPASGSAIFKARMNSPRKDFGVAVLDDKIYIFGGSASFDSQGKNVLLGNDSNAGVFMEAVVDSIERYDVYANACEKVDIIDEAVAGVRAVEYFGNIYLLGGWYGGYISNVTKYFGAAYPKNIQMTTANNGENINIKWSKVNSATGYEVEIDGTVFVKSQNEHVFTPGSNSYDLPIRVRAVKNGKYSLWSDMLYFSRNESMLDAQQLSFDFSLSDKLYRTGQTKWYKVSADQAGTVNLTLSNVPAGCDYIMQFRNSSGDVIATSSSTISNIVVTEYNYYITVTSVSGSSSTNSYNIAGDFTAVEESGVPDRIKAAFLQPSSISDGISSSSLKSLSDYDGDDEPEKVAKSIAVEMITDAPNGGMSEGTKEPEEIEEPGDPLIQPMSFVSTPTQTSHQLSSQGSVYNTSVTIPGSIANSMTSNERLKVVIIATPTDNLDDIFDLSWISSGNALWSYYYDDYHGYKKIWYLVATLPRSTATRIYDYKVTYSQKSSGSGGHFTLDTYIIKDNSSNEDFTGDVGNELLENYTGISVGTNSSINKNGKIDHPLDYDYYRVDVSSNQKLSVSLTYPSGKKYYVRIRNSQGTYIEGWNRDNNDISFETINTGTASYFYIIVLGDGVTFSADEAYTLTVCRYNISSLGDLEINNEFSDADSKMSTFRDTYLGTPKKVAKPINFSIDSPMDEDRYAVQMLAGDKISIQMNLPLVYNDSTHKYRIAICSDVNQSPSHVSWLERSYNNPNSARTKTVTFIAEKDETYYVSVSSLTRQYNYNMMGTLTIIKTPSSYLDSNENKGNECSNDFISITLFTLLGLRFGVYGWSPITSSASANFDNELDVDWYKYTNGAKSKNMMISLSGGTSITSSCGLVVLDGNYKFLSDGGAGLVYNFAPNTEYYIGAYVKNKEGNNPHPYDSVKDSRDYTLSLSEVPQFKGNVTEFKVNGDEKKAKLGHGNKVSFLLTGTDAGDYNYTVKLQMGWDNGVFYDKASQSNVKFSVGGTTKNITFNNITIGGTNGKKLKTRILVMLGNDVLWTSSEYTQDVTKVMPQTVKFDLGIDEYGYAEDGKKHFYIFDDQPEHLRESDLLDAANPVAVAHFENLEPGVYTVFSGHGPDGSINALNTFFNCVFYNTKKNNVDQSGVVKVNKIGFRCLNTTQGVEGYRRLMGAWTDYRDWQNAELYKNYQYVGYNLPAVTSANSNSFLWLDEKFLTDPNTVFSMVPTWGGFSYLMMEFEVISGTVNFATVGYHNISTAKQNFNNLNQNGSVKSYYERGGTLKGIGQATQTIKAAPMEYYINDFIVDGTKLPFSISNWFVQDRKLDMFTTNCTPLGANTRWTVPASSVVPITFEGEAIIRQNDQYIPSSMKTGSDYAISGPNSGKWVFDGKHSRLTFPINSLYNSVGSSTANYYYNNYLTANAEYNSNWMAQAVSPENTYGASMPDAYFDFENIMPFVHEFGRAPASQADWDYYSSLSGEIGTVNTACNYQLTQEYTVTVHNAGSDRIFSYVMGAHESVEVEWIVNGVPAGISLAKNGNTESFTREVFNILLPKGTTTVTMRVTMMNGSNPTINNAFIINPSTAQKTQNLMDRYHIETYPQN